MAKFTSKSPKAMSKAPAVPPMAGGKATGKMPERGQRTATNKATRGDVQHPGSHDAWEKLGS